MVVVAVAHWTSSRQQPNLGLFWPCAVGHSLTSSLLSPNTLEVLRLAFDMSLMELATAVGNVFELPLCGQQGQCSESKSDRHPHCDAMAEAKIEDGLREFLRWFEDPLNDALDVTAFLWSAQN